MTYTEAIRSGFQTINSRWQLVGVQAGLMLLNCISFFVIVGIPLFIAFVIFGLDLTNLTNPKDFFGMFASPSDFISKYLWIVLAVVTCLMLYLLLVSTLGLFVFGGSAGLIGRSILVPSLGFSMKAFAEEGKKLFFPLMWYSLFVGLVFLLIAFVMGLFGGGVAAIVSVAKTQDSTLALFLGIFFSLIVSLIVISIIVAVLAVTVYGIAVLFFKGETPVKAFKAAARFLWNRQDALWLYTILFAGYIACSFMTILVSYPFHLLPIVGTIISFPIQLMSYIVQGYLGLVVLAVTFTYYYESEIKPNEQAVQGEDALSATDEGSTSPESTSAPATQQQEEVLPLTDEKPED